MRLHAMHGPAGSRPHAPHRATRPALVATVLTGVAVLMLLRVSRELGALTLLLAVCYLICLLPLAPFLFGRRRPRDDADATEPAAPRELSESDRARVEAMLGEPPER